MTYSAWTLCEQQVSIEISKRWHSLQVTAYRNGSAYQLWQLHRLAKESDCQKILLKEDAISLLIPLLVDKQLAAGSASILQRLSTEEGAQKVLQAGEHPSLVAM